MNTLEIHEKRMKRTALKKVDRYRAESAFHKQRNQALAKDLRLTGSRLAASLSAKELLGRDANQLRQDVADLSNHIKWMESYWLVRVVIWFCKK